MKAAVLLIKRESSYQNRNTRTVKRISVSGKYIAKMFSVKKFLVSVYEHSTTLL